MKKQRNLVLAIIGGMFFFAGASAAEKAGVEEAALGYVGAGEAQFMNDGEETPDCGECEGQVTELTLLYNGDVAVHVEVTQKIRSREVTIFSDLVEPDEPFTISGVRHNGTLGAKISIYVDGHFEFTIHTSCSEPIGPGLIMGNFEVIDGQSRNGGRLCPLENPDGNMSCAECEGQVTELSLRYIGDQAVHVEVTQKIRSHEVAIFDELLEPDDAFTIFGARSNGTLGAKVQIYVDGENVGEIHTSCSEPIGPGLIVGDFEVIDGASRRGGRLCPLPADGS